MFCKLPRDPGPYGPYFYSAMDDIDYSNIDQTDPSLVYALMYDPSSCKPWSFLEISGGGGGTDQLVKISVNDTTSGYLSAKIANLVGPAFNSNAIKYEILNPGANEQMLLWLDLSNYIGNVTITGTTTFNGPVNFNTGPVNFNNVIINHTDVTENYLDTPILISCEPVPTFGVAAISPPLTQFAEIDVTFDNGPGATDNIVSRTVLNGITQTIYFTSGVDTGSISISWVAGSVTVTILTGNPLFFTLNSICFYNGVSVNNYSNKIHIYNGDMFEYNNTTQTHNNTVINGTIINNANNTYNGSNTFNGPTTITNLIVTGPIVGFAMQNDTFAGDGITTVFVLVMTANNTNVRVFVNGLRQTPTTDYTATTTQVTFTVAPILGAVIVVDYLG